MAHNQIKAETVPATVKLVDKINMDEFGEHFGLTLTVEAKILIKTAMLVYTMGVLCEHPIGTGKSALSRAAMSISENPALYTHVGNKSTKKFHEPSFSSVSDMKDKRGCR